MWKKLLNITSIVLTIIIAGLQMMPVNWKGILWQFLRDNSFYIVLVSGILVVLLHIIDMFCNSDENNKKMWLTTFLKHIVDEHLCGDVYHTRISILRRQNGFKVFCVTFWYYVVRNFINNFKYKTWKASFKSIAIHWLSSYLVVYVRYSSPKKESSCTYFRLSDKNSGKLFNGIGDKCFQEGIAINVMTEDISDLQPLPYDIAELSSKNKKRVQKYMKKCCFHESFYNSIRNMRQISCNLYAVPVTLVDQSIWGVVIVDSDGTTPRNFEDALKDYMASYMKIINFTLSSLK